MTWLLCCGGKFMLNQYFHVKRISKTNSVSRTIFKVSDIHISTLITETKSLMKEMVYAS
jgi:hypothetical protein